MEDMQTKRALFTKLSLNTFLIALASMIVLVLPLTDNFITHTKTYLLFCASIVVFFLFGIRSLKRGSFELHLTPLTIPLVLFAASALLSSFIPNPYLVESLLGLGGVYLAVVLIGVFGSILLPKANSEKFLVTLGAAAGIVFLFTALQNFGLGASQLLNWVFNLSLPDNFAFNLTGSSLVALQISAAALIGLATHAVTKKRIPTVGAVLIPMLAIAALVYGWSMLPGKPGVVQLPSLSASWSVALDTLRLPKTAVFGVGPASYTNAYNFYKPQWVNGQPYWSVAFSQASSFPLTLLTTMGLVGLGAWIFLAARLIKICKEAKVENRGLAAVVITLLILQLITPVSVVLLAVFAIAVAMLLASEKENWSLIQIQPLSVRIIKKTNDSVIAESKRDTKSENLFKVLVAVLLVGLVSLTYFVGRSYAAQVLMNESSKAILDNDAVSAYQQQQAAVKLNPYLDQHRRRYAATNMLIAIAISNKVDMSESDQQQVTQLIQQAIREARAATLLDPGDVENWLTLAQIYENMIGATPDAVNWAIQSYVRAIEAHPTDPGLRLALGGIFLNQQQPEQAAGIFQQAVSLKPDYANGYFNLAVALRQMGQLEQSKAALQQVLVMLDSSSEEYIAVTRQLEEVEEEIKAKGSADPNQESESKLVPNLIDQNLEHQNDVVTQPGGVDLNQGENANESNLNEASQESLPEFGQENREQETASPSAGQN